ncbi:hypothetical protein PybrP1_004575 [[Pythium] brassicae (nom. inval.)]|nr:hypothetical protein PybrP1_004575 [[Pythium] brassicae (nom. inval.)]
MENTPPPAAAWELARSASSGLKRTISKCSMDDALYESGGGKKLAGAFDDGEAVLLPRGAGHRHHHHHHHHHSDEPEGSPPLFGWNDSPAAMKSRYYDNLLDGTAMASPSPHHLLYSTASASTVSLDSTPLAEREYISPATLHAALLDYLGEVFTYYSRAKGYTFMQLAQSLRTAQSSFRYIQGTVKVRLGVTWELVGSFVENVLDFISDEDIREATVLEFACFLREMEAMALQRWPSDNIFANLFEFFREVLEQFKRYLAKLWVQLRRINFPCEFGKKSETLFLCMECHREHL